MTKIAIIGGTGLATLTSIKVLNEKFYETQYGQTDAPLVTGILSDIEVIFLARHGIPHVIPPHKVNYRANLRALKDSGISDIISVNAVGGITNSMQPGTIVIPDQVIDYTYCRKHTYYDDGLDQVIHIDFTHPYSKTIRNILIKSAKAISTNLKISATYGATQGPRLETAAEIKKLEQDGCDLVGMTGMPEASLARELDMNYASICLVVNWAAGKTNSIITMEAIQSHIKSGMKEINLIIKNAICSF
jgi:5'-methylthioinosine phosphorylase